MSRLRNLAEDLSDKVIAGAILSPDGIIYSTTPEFKPTGKEFIDLQLFNWFEPNSEVKTSGIVFREDLYMVTHYTSDLIVAQNEGHAIAFGNCGVCIVFGYVDDSMEPSECMNAVNDLSKKIRDIDFQELLENEPI